MGPGGNSIPGLPQVCVMDELGFVGLWPLNDGSGSAVLQWDLRCAERREIRKARC